MESFEPFIIQKKPTKLKMLSKVSAKLKVNCNPNTIKQTLNYQAATGAGMSCIITYTSSTANQVNMLNIWDYSFVLW